MYLLYQCYNFFVCFNQNDYSRALLLQLQQWEYMKYHNHPIYQLLLNEPSCFLEVKGEWSLCKLTSLLNPQSRNDSELTSKKYKLLRESISSEELFIGTESIAFQSYPSQVKNIKNDCAEVSIISDSLYTLIRDIFSNSKCIYPKPLTYSYSKKSRIKLLRPNNLTATNYFSFDISPKVTFTINIYAFNNIFLLVYER